MAVQRLYGWVACSLICAGAAFAAEPELQPATPVPPAPVADAAAPAPAPAAQASADTPCEERDYSVLITVKNVKSDKGVITVDLHGDDPSRWLKKGGRIGRVRVPAVPGETKICMPVEHAGTYAFALYHDKDHNLKLNKTWIGLPDEPFAVSNDAPIRLGPPSFKDASFQITGPLTPESVELNN
ncbi:MAG: DUF2141 domain-containing protein [Rhodospirillaceae bacterium]|nr:DUF2141 domain-containing protein [Rhodospirillaceae bacterium]